VELRRAAFGRCLFFFAGGYDGLKTWRLFRGLRSLGWFHREC
jgi:hypothetical protein